MSRVFVLQEPIPRSLTGWVPDIRPASKHGEISYVFNKADKPHSWPQEQVEFRLKEVLRAYDPKEDSILWCGGDLIVLILCTAYMAFEFEIMHLLQWQRADNGGFYSRTPVAFGHI